MIEDFTNDELLFLTEVLNDVLLEYEDIKSDEARDYCENVFKLLQKTIRNIK